MEEKEYQFLKNLMREHGIKGSIRGLACAMRMHADDLSDLNMKEDARKAAEWAEILSDLLVE